MGELESKKRKRVISFQRNTTTTLNFYYNYMSCLLPALLKFQSLRGGEDKEEVLNTVRFEVNMALVKATSGGGFGWNRALRRRLQKDSNRSQLSFLVSPTIGRSLVPSMQNRGSKQKPRRVVRKWRRRGKCGVVSGEDLGSRIKKLRTILPGGKEMGVSELLSEVGSYVVYLEMQVSVLRCLVGCH